MRIVHLNPFYFPYAGGIERRIRATARRLASRHEVHVVTAALPEAAPGTTREDGFEVHRLPSSFPLRRYYNPPPVRTPRVGEALRRLAPDVVDYHFRWSPGYARAFRRLEDVGRVVTYHNTYGEGLGVLGWASRLNDRLYMRTVRRAHRVVCVSDRVRSDLAGRGADQARLVVNPNAVERDEVARIEGRPQTPLERPYVVAVGRLVRLKGFDVLVDAWRHVPEPLDLVLVGQGPGAAALARRARRRGVGDRVRLVGWVSEDEKIRLLKRAVAYAHPARFESFPLSILEALAAGAPVVAARVGGIPEVVGDAGLLLGHEPLEWARALADLARDDVERKRRAAASLARSERFDWDALTRALERVYEEAAAIRAGPGVP